MLPKHYLCIKFWRRISQRRLRKLSFRENTFSNSIYNNTFTGDWTHSCEGKCERKITFVHSEGKLFAIYFVYLLRKVIAKNKISQLFTYSFKMTNYFWVSYKITKIRHIAKNVGLLLVIKSIEAVNVHLIPLLWTIIELTRKNQNLPLA